MNERLSLLTPLSPLRAILLRTDLPGRQALASQVLLLRWLPDTAARQALRSKGRHGVL